MFGRHATQFDCALGGTAPRRYPSCRAAEGGFAQAGRANPASSPISNIRSVICCAMLLVLGPSKQDLIRAIR
jgi:hypothetical protein